MSDAAARCREKLAAIEARFAERRQRAADAKRRRESKRLYREPRPQPEPLVHIDPRRMPCGHFTVFAHQGRCLKCPKDPPP